MVWHRDLPTAARGAAAAHDRWRSDPADNSWALGNEGDRSQNSRDARQQQSDANRTRYDDGSTNGSGGSNPDTGVWGDRPTIRRVIKIVIALAIGDQEPFRVVRTTTRDIPIRSRVAVRRLTIPAAVRRVRQCPAAAFSRGGATPEALGQSFRSPPGRRRRSLRRLDLGRRRRRLGRQSARKPRPRQHRELIGELQIATAANNTNPDDFHIPVLPAGGGGANEDDFWSGNNPHYMPSASPYANVARIQKSVIATRQGLRTAQIRFK